MAGPRTDVAAASNARLTQVVDYTTEQRGWRQFLGMAGRTRRELTTAPAVIERWPQFDGYAASPQLLRGLAPLALGGGAPLAEATSTLSDEKSAGLDDPALRIFRERLRRQTR